MTDQIYDRDFHPSKRQRLETDISFTQSWYLSGGEQEEDRTHSSTWQPTSEPIALRDTSFAISNQQFDFSTHSYCSYYVDTGTDVSFNTESKTTRVISENCRVVDEVASAAHSSRPNRTVVQEEQDGCILLNESSQQSYTESKDEVPGALQAVIENNQECFGVVSKP